MGLFTCDLVSAPTRTDHRPQVRGKFVFSGEEKLYLRGVTYGTFRPSRGGTEYPAPATVDRDFAQMAASGVNAVRTYSVPPRWLLDSAAEHGLRVMVGLPWEQHVAFLEDGERARAIEERVRAGVRACASHPAVLCYAVGNEIPAPIVRWHGRHRMERFIKRLCQAAKAEDPDGLVTYVNYPSTEYLQLPFLDLVCFNVYLESQRRLESYLSRLQTLAGDRPLVLTEIGLDSRRNGEDVQARVLDWQIRTVFAAGAAGAFAFSWTDEWHRGGYAVEDWDFGLTDRARRPKPALAAVRKAFAEVPFSRDLPWPHVSVVVCTYNGARTIRDCLQGLSKLQYPSFEVIVVDDGSSDGTASIAQEYDVRVISTENRGLGSARNTGLRAATGEIVAYLDDDAYPDPHWLTYLAASFLNTTHAGVGGPNIAPPGDGPIADCVANAPGNPVHVLLSDREAEHIPGCNMAFRTSCLQAIDGFDTRYRVAGDDVDVCWRIRARGWTLGFSPAAMVWHHRRNSVHAYWKQQYGYGKAEALLEVKWPEKYNGVGHLVWAGRVYGQGLTQPLSQGSRRIFYGTWGSALFQSLYHPAPNALSSLLLMPEWYLLVVALAGLSALGTLVTPLFSALPVLALAVGVIVAQAGLSASRARFQSTSRLGRPMLWVLTTLLHLLQPLARLDGRLRNGLAPWRRRGASSLSPPVPRTYAVWSESWRAPEQWLQRVEAALRAEGAAFRRGGDYDRWELEVGSSVLGAARLRMAVEEHGAGKQLVRFRLWPRCSAQVLATVLLFAVLSLGSALQQLWLASGILGLACALLSVRAYEECADAAGALRQACGAIGDGNETWT